MELLIVLAILAVLYLMVVRNFIGFNTEAKIVATKSSADALRSTIQLFRAKEGRYPSSLGDLLTETYSDAGIERPYLTRMPPEQISRPPDDSYEDLRSTDPPSNDGGWNYFTDRADVATDLQDPLDNAWGDAAGEIPSTW